MQNQSLTVADRSLFHYSLPWDSIQIKQQYFYLFSILFIAFFNKSYCYYWQKVLPPKFQPFTLQCQCHTQRIANRQRQGGSYRLNNIFTFSFLLLLFLICCLKLGFSLIISSPSLLVYFSEIYAIYAHSLHFRDFIFQVLLKLPFIHMI